MSETSCSLLDTLRQRPDEQSWQRFLDLYRPFIQSWLRRYAALPQDADDVVQEILAVVVRKLPEFRREPRTGAFRRWLLGVTVNCLRRHRRSGRHRPLATGDSAMKAALEQLEDPASGLSRVWDAEHDQHVTRQLLEQIRPRFEATTWEAFRRVTFDERRPADVAAELGLSVNAVFIAKSRVLTQLRQAAQGLLDD